MEFKQQPEFEGSLKNYRGQHKCLLLLGILLWLAAYVHSTKWYVTTTITTTKIHFSCWQEGNYKKINIQSQFISWSLGCFVILVLLRLTADRWPGPLSWCSLQPGCGGGQRSSWPASPGWWRRSEHDTCCPWFCNKRQHTSVVFRYNALASKGGGGAADIKRHIGSDRSWALSVVLTEMMMRWEKLFFTLCNKTWLSVSHYKALLLPYSFFCTAIFYSWEFYLKYMNNMMNYDHKMLCTVFVRQ